MLSGDRHGVARVLSSGDAAPSRIFLSGGTLERFRVVGVILMYCVMGSISTSNPDLSSPFSGTSLLATSVPRDPPTVCLSGLQSVVGGRCRGEGGREVCND